MFQNPLWLETFAGVSEFEDQSICLSASSVLRTKRVLKNIPLKQPHSHNLSKFIHFIKIE